MDQRQFRTAGGRQRLSARDHWMAIVVQVGGDQNMLVDHDESPEMSVATSMASRHAIWAATRFFSGFIRRWMRNGQLHCISWLAVPSLTTVIMPGVNAGASSGLYRDRHVPTRQ